MRAGLSWLRIVYDLVHVLCLVLRFRVSLAAENLFLRKPSIKSARLSPDGPTIRPA